VSASDSFELKQLASDIIRDCDTNVVFQKEKLQSGQKDEGLVIGLTIVGLVLTSIDILINMLTYWASKRPKYSLSFEIDGETYTLEGYSANELNKMKSEIQRLNPPKVRILILN